MKKQLLKELLRIKEQRLTRLAYDFEEVSEALSRRRILYDRLANHATCEKPKSMNEMAASLYDIYCTKSLYIPKFEELPDAEKDEWMDRLLTILN